MEERIIANSYVEQEVGMMLGGEWSCCWLWFGARTQGGRYGKLSIRWKRGPRKGKVRTMLAHRMSLIAFTGRFLGAKMVAKHLCNHGLCVNPAHLQGGTQKSNVRQAVKQGRHRNQYSKE